MNRSLPTRSLPQHPDLQQLRRQAKELLHTFQAGDPAAVAEVNRHFRDANPATFELHDAQLVLARAYGFDSWPKLKAFVDGVNVRSLAEAVRRNDLSRVRAMLDARPELVKMDTAENDEHQALHFAVLERSPEMVRLLMQRGANPRSGIYPHRRATTALAIATERGYDEIAAILREEEGRRRNPDDSPLADQCVEAILEGEEAAALALLEQHPEIVRSANREEWSPLHAAACVRSEALVRWLLEHGAEVNRLGPRGFTVLDAAVAGQGLVRESEGFVPVAELLQKAGAQQTARAAVALGDAAWLRTRHAEGKLENDILDWGGLLTVAVIYDRPEILEWMLQVGFDPDERVRLNGLEDVFYSQAMPLWQCAATGKTALAEMLLRYGARPNVHVYASGSPVYSAVRHGQREMLALLQRCGGIVDPVTIGLFKERELARQMLADESTGKVPREVLEGRNVSEDLLRGAADSGDPAILRMALPGVDWDRSSDRWFWMLMHSIWAASPECLELMIERCDPNLRHPRFGRVILHDVAGLGGEATAARSPELAAVLLDAGARLEIRDDLLKSTPLGWACRWGRLPLVRFLLDRGADPVEADAEPWATPRAWALKMGHREIVDVLDQRVTMRG